MPINEQGELVVSRSLYMAQGKPNLLVKHPRVDSPISVLQLPSGEFAATLMRCTHQQCETAYSEANYVCPCHGARFTHKGRVIKGPASENLQSFAVTVSSDTLRIRVG